MKTRSRFLYPLLVVLLFFAGCKKEEEIDKLPPATASGLGTFGCLINGKAWPVYEKGYHLLQTGYYNGVLQLTYTIKENELSAYTSSIVSIITNEINKPGAYIINFSNNHHGNFSVKQRGVYYFSNDQINQSNFAWVNITRLDTVYGFAAGTFGFTLFDENGLTSVKVESGRFDISY